MIAEGSTWKPARWQEDQNFNKKGMLLDILDMLVATKKKQVHETEHLPKFGVTSMDIFIQVNA